jgi:methionine-rich copper-binding protein CopC
MYLEFFQAAKTENWSNFTSHQEAHPKSHPKFFGPWREAREMVEQLARRHDVFQKGFFRKRFPDADTEIAAVTEAFTNAVQAVLDQLQRMRENENELDPDRPFVLDHGALNGAWNIIVKETAVVGVTDFANAAYVPYSKAVSDLTNQMPSYEESVDSNAHGVHFDVSERVEENTEPVSLSMPEAQGRHWDQRNDNNYKGRRFDLTNTKELKQRWGEITWEDLVHGDRFEDHHASNEIYSETPPIVFRKKQKAWQRSGNMPRPRGDYDVHRVLPRHAAVEANEIRTAWIAKTWFVEPVLFLVDQFVKSYLKEDDPMGLWQDPLVIEVAGCKRGKGPAYFAEMARKLADETHKAKETASP